MWDRGTKVLTGFGWYAFESTIQTNISKDYLDGEKAWNSWAALRECLQNVADEADFMREKHGGALTDYVDVKLRKEWIFIRDYGRGCEFENILLLGKSSKRGLNYRGEKGEGQLMAFLTFSKLDVDIELFSQNWLIRPRFDKYNGGENEVLVLDVYRQANPDNPRALKNGTVTRIQRTSELEVFIENLVDYFPDLRKSTARQRNARDKKAIARIRNEKRKRVNVERRERKRKSTSSVKSVFMPRKGNPPRLYLRGIYVRDLTVATGLPAMFCYNVANASINRDRTMVNQAELYTEVKRALESNDVTKAMRATYWKYALEATGCGDRLEYRVEPNLTNDTQRREWKKSFVQVYGKQACLFTNQFAASDAASDSWTVVRLQHRATFFAQSLNVLTDRQAAGFGDSDWTVLKPTTRETEILDTCYKTCKLLNIKTAPVFVVGRVLGQPNLQGFFKYNQVYILRKVFDNGMDVLKVFLHEHAHLATGETDFTRKFTDWFLSQWLNALSTDNAEIRTLITNLW